MRMYEFAGPPVQVKLSPWARVTEVMEVRLVQFSRLGDDTDAVNGPISLPPVPVKV